MRLYTFIFIFIIINFQFLINIIFINQFNLPDGYLHERLFTVYTSFNLPTSLSEYLINFDLYNISTIKNFIVQLFPSLEQNCYIADWKSDTTVIDSCHQRYDLSDQFQGKFGLDTQLFDYSSIIKFTINELSLFIYLIITTGILFIIFIIFPHKNVVPTIIIFLSFPSIINALSYISPGILSILLQCIFFYFFLRKMFLEYFILALFLVILDKQNLTNLFFITFFFFIYFLSFLNLFEVKYKSIIYLCFSLIIFTIILNYTGILPSLIKVIAPNLYGDYTYLNIGESNIFRSIVITYLSLYYVGGSMTHLAHIFEYLVFLFLILFFLYKNIFSKKVGILSDKMNLNFLYFIIGNFIFIEFLIVFSNINQGRYYSFILLPIIYYFVNIIKLKKINFLIIIFGFFVLNNIKILKFISSGYL